jgi:hypothetical protein
VGTPFISAFHVAHAAEVSGVDISYGLPNLLGKDPKVTGTGRRQRADKRANLLTHTPRAICLVGGFSQSGESIEPSVDSIDELLPFVIHV